METEETEKAAEAAEEGSGSRGRLRQPRQSSHGTRTIDETRDMSAASTSKIKTRYSLGAVGGAW